MSYNNIPADLKKLRQWVCFKFTDRGNGLKGKVPVDPKTGNNAKANDASTWGSYEEAIQGLMLYNLDGIGFEFANGVFGVDLDHVIENGQLSPEAKDIVETMQSYTEYSPSGTGLHILCRGSIPEGDRRNGAIEIYEAGRFFTVTGKHYPGTPLEALERTQEAAKVHKKYIYREPDKKPVQRPGEAAEVTESDAELLEKMFNSKNGAEIRALWEGNTDSQGNDHSAADLALVRYLCYWTNGDAARIDSLFRKSGLMRSKWDNNYNYGKKTIEKVLSSFSPYTVQTPLKKITSHGKVIYDATAATMPGKEAPKVQENTKQLITAADFLKTKFKEERDAFNAQKARKTGFTNIDEAIGGLYSGLYVIGAQSSLGKTTLMLQIADQLAAQGEKVLYFSLEQSAFELTSKSLARESYKISRSVEPGKALSAIQIRNGTPLTEDAKTGYRNYIKYADNIYIKEGNFSETIEDIQKEVEAFIAAQGVKPVVIIDYLQIIQPIDKLIGANDKAQTDYTIHALKTMQRNNDLVLFVISSFNRANYMQPVSFESFKETGGIEYTCDVLWGLQYSAITTSPAFAKDSGTGCSIKDKREAIKQAKRATPRQIQLVCLKNRYGMDYDAYFTYMPAYDYFAVDTMAEKMAKM